MSLRDENKTKTRSLPQRFFLSRNHGFVTKAHACNWALNAGSMSHLLLASRERESGHLNGKHAKRVWLKIKQEGLRRFWSMFPLIPGQPILVPFFSQPRALSRQSGPSLPWCLTSPSRYLSMNSSDTLLAPRQ